MAERSRKRRKSYCPAPNPKRKRSAWKGELCPGLTGVLISTSDRESLCVPEAYNLFNEYADQLYGPEVTADDSTNSEDVACSLKQEVEKLRGSEQRPRRFQAVDTGTRHLVFIKCQPPVDPVKLVHHMLSSVMESGEHKARFCQRFIPVSSVCHASTKHIQKCASDLFTPYFHQQKFSLKFAVVYKARNNHDLDREEIIRTLASLVTGSGDYPHRVDLLNPDLTIVVEIIKGNFCISVVKDFNKLKRYNIQSIMATQEENKRGETEAPPQSEDVLKTDNTMDHCEKQN